MDGTHERRGTIDNEGRCSCREEDNGPCYVLMNSREYGTEVWPCSSLEEAIQTLSRLARSAEQHRRIDGAQRYFCILGELPAQEQEAVCDPVSPDAPDAGTLTLILHFREASPCREPEPPRCLCLHADDTRKESETRKEVAA